MSDTGAGRDTEKKKIYYRRLQTRLEDPNMGCSGGKMCPTPEKKCKHCGGAE